MGWDGIEGGMDGCLLHASVYDEADACRWLKAVANRLTLHDDMLMTAVFFLVSIFNTRGSAFNMKILYYNM